MNGIILYQSKYGATKKYAQWLSEKTVFPCVETKQARISDVREYDTILLGGGSMHRALPVYLSYRNTSKTCRAGKSSYSVWVLPHMRKKPIGRSSPGT